LHWDKLEIAVSRFLADCFWTYNPPAEAAKHEAVPVEQAAWQRVSSHVWATVSGHGQGATSMTMA
jgi:hypothetical protein